MSTVVVVVRSAKVGGFKELREQPHTVATRGYLSEVPPEAQLEILKYTASHISAKTTMIAFKPSKDSAPREHYEDEGRTIIKPIDRIKETIYAILDDHQTKENLSEWCGEEVSTQYLLTFLLAQEY